MNYKIFIAPLIAGLIAAGLSFVIYGKPVIIGTGAYSIWLFEEFISGFAITLAANFIAGFFTRGKDEK